MSAGYSFRPRAWAFALALAASVAGIALGQWQSQRAAAKRALGEELERSWRAPPIELDAQTIRAEALVMKRVAAQGRFLDEHTVYLDNRLRRGRAGYEVVTPLRLNGMHVLVNRGWVAAPKTRDVLPPAPAPAGEVRVEGLALARLAHALEAGEGPHERRRQNLDLAAYAKETGLRLHPIVIEQHSTSSDGLVREWTRPDAGVDKHQSYALQWYSLAGLAIVLFVVLSFRRDGAA